MLHSTIGTPSSSPSPSPSSSPQPPQPPVRLLDQVRERVRYLHYSLRTEQAYVHWIRAFVRQQGMRHPLDMGQPEVEAFLSWLAVDRQVAVSTHRQALSALLFLYQQVLGVRLPWMDAMARPQRPPRLPVVLSATEVARILALMRHGEHRVLAQLLYGTGMRIAEALSLRVKDVDFDARTVVVRAGKGGKDRPVMLPLTLAERLHEQLRYPARCGWPTASPAMPAYSCPTRWTANTRRPAGNGAGSGCFRRPICRYARAAACSGATTCTTRRSSAPSGGPSSGPASRGRQRRTRFGIRSPPTCCRTATTSAPCRRCSATATSARRWSTPMC